MADLLDIAPSTACESVKIDGKRITVRGLNLTAIASIASRFPKLASLLGGIIAGGDNILPMLVEQFGNAIGPIIAAGCGHLDDEERERKASMLRLEDQLKLLKAILGLTFPNGFGSFVDQLTNFIGGTGEETKVYKVRLKRSPSTSPISSDEASRLNMQ
jgi:hypothetical protein